MSLNDNALTTVQRLADFLGLGTITVDSARETILELIVNSISQFIETYTGRTFKQTAYSNELYDIDDKSVYLHLKNYPVSSTASFTLERRESYDNEDDWETIDSEDYFIDYLSGIIQYAAGRKFQPGPKAYRVSYTAGYNFDNSTTFLASFLADLEYTAWKLGATAWNNRRGSVGIKSERIGDLAVVYTKEIFESPEIKEILDKYTKEGLASTVTPGNT